MPTTESRVIYFIVKTIPAKWFLLTNARHYQSPRISILPVIQLFTFRYSVSVYSIPHFVLNCAGDQCNILFGHLHSFHTINTTLTFYFNTFLITDDVISVSCYILYDHWWSPFLRAVSNYTVRIYLGCFELGYTMLFPIQWNMFFSFYSWSFRSILFYEALFPDFVFSVFLSMLPNCTVSIILYFPFYTYVVRSFKIDI